MARRTGRPPGLKINPAALEDLLGRTSLTKQGLCQIIDISPGHLSDMLYRQKGTSKEVVERMALALRCSPGTLAPELTTWFAAVRPGAAGTDDAEAA